MPKPFVLRSRSVDEELWAKLLKQRLTKAFCKAIKNLDDCRFAFVFLHLAALDRVGDFITAIVQGGVLEERCGSERATVLSGSTLSFVVLVSNRPLDTLTSMTSADSTSRLHESHDLKVLFCRLLYFGKQLRHGRCQAPSPAKPIKILKSTGHRIASLLVDKRVLLCASHHGCESCFTERHLLCARRVASALCRHAIEV